MVSIDQRRRPIGIFVVLLLLGILGCVRQVANGSIPPTTPPYATGVCDQAFATALNDAITPEPRDDVVIRYSWTEGHGIGDVEAVLASSGNSTLKLTPDGGKPRELITRIRWKRYLRLLRLAQAAQFGCLQAVERERCIRDLGVYRLSIQVGDHDHLIMDDGEHYVPGNPALNDLYGEIYALKSLFGERFDWGPVGTLTFPCELLKQRNDG